MPILPVHIIGPIWIQNAKIRAKILFGHFLDPPVESLAVDWIGAVALGLTQYSASDSEVFLPRLKIWFYVVDGSRDRNLVVSKQVSENEWNFFDLGSTACDGVALGHR